MDSGETPGESIVLSVPSSPGNVEGGIERQDPVTPTPTPIRKAWVVLLDKCVHIFLHDRVIFAIILLLCAPLLAVYMPLLPVAKKWKRVFILSCVAVSIDCLFLYIPIIDQENKCLGSDKRLRNIALVLRSITDIAFILHILLLMDDEMDEDPKWDDSNKDPAKASWLSKKMPRLSIYIIVNFLAILPIPQVAIVVGFSKLGGSKHFVKQTTINVFLIFQYILRIFQIFLSIKNVGDTVGKLVKGSFYFLMYVLASHVLAAFWYFFSIQREISCWDKACRAIGECMPIYECGRNTSLNSTSISKLCPIDSPDATLFDFGMFLDILQSGNTSSTKFSTKFFYSFWWGLRNLSNFGTNLETSSYIWENCFAILICVIGLLLFLFLIGNVQTYIQSESEKFVKIRDSRRMRINTKYRELEKWMSSHDVPDDMKTDTLKNISEYRTVERINKDVGARFMHRCCYKKDFKSDPLNFICVKALKRIPVLRKLDEQDLKGFCDHKFITTNDKDTLITRAGQELFNMYLIIDGVVACNDPETMSTQTMHRYDCVGQELLRWAILNNKRSEEQRERRPISTVDAKCLTDGEAFGIHASDLLEILQKLNNLELASTSCADQRIEEWLLRNGFPEDLKANIMNFLDQNNLVVEENMRADVDVAFLFGILPRDMKPSMKRHLGMNALKKVPMLQKMHEYVMEIICNYLQPVVFEKDSYIVRAGEPLSIMIFILRGTVIFTDTTSSNTRTTSSSEITENFDENVIEIHSYYGEQLLRWASPNNISSSDNPVISTRNVKCQTKVESLILKAEDLRSAISKCGSQWNLINNMNYQHLVGDVRDTLADTGDSTSTKIEETGIQLHQGHDMLLEQLLLIRETMFQFRDDMVRRLDDQRQRLDDQGGRLNEMAAFLARLGYTGTSSP